MYSLRVVNHRGETLDLNNNPNYTVFKIDGLAPPAVNINQTDNSTVDGGIISNARVSKRNLVIYMTIDSNVETSRINLYKYFPLKQTISIYFSNGTRNVYIKGMVEIIECDLFSNKQIAQISIICPKPYFKGIEEMITYFSDVNALFQFPFSLTAAGSEISTYEVNIRKTIINTGDVECGIIIELFAASGNVVKPVIYDVFTKEFIKINFTLLQSDKITINTNQGEKLVTLTRNGVTTNAMGYLSPDSTWIQLAAGDNVFTYSSDSGNANLQITFKTQLLYGGV